MSNTPNDVRQHLTNMLAQLGDKTATPEQMAQSIEAAKATSSLAQAYTGVLKAEIEGVRTLHDTGMAPLGLGKAVRYDLNTGKAKSITQDAAGG